MVDQLANSLYPIDYFVQAGVDQIQYPNEFWWQSRMRYARVGARGQYDSNGNLTHEYLEIDLSRVRQVGYLNFSVLRAPIDILIEYDALSDQDTEHQWVAVTPIPGETFDNQIHYSAAHRSPWMDAEFYFTDSQGETVNTRFIRIRFKRRDTEWPHKNAKPFRWSIMVKGLRPARLINHYGDTRGILFDSGGPTGELPGSEDLLDPTHVLMGITDVQYNESNVTSTDWVKQQFGLPFDTARGSSSPSLMGFSWLFWIEPNQPTAEFLATPNESLVSIQWKLYDVTNRAGAPILVKSGINHGALYSEHGWVNVYFDPEDVIPTAMPNTSPVYELWVKSLSVHVDANDGLGPRQILGKFIEQNRAVTGQTLFSGTATNGSNTIVMASAASAALVQNGDLIQRIDRVDAPATVSNVIGTSVFLTAPYAGSSATTNWERVLPITVGSGSPDYTKSACMRLWADVGDSGRDVLGNSYRYTTLKDSADAVLDDALVGWLSEPQPSTDAVESMYFDTRYTDIKGKKQPGVIDAIRIAPRTPGVVMHIYYSDNHGSSITPKNSTQWNQIIWKPIHTTYTLNGDSTITLPTTISANYVKLEFTKLQPRPIHLPKRPAPPLVEFNRYPTWVENQFDNSSVRRTVEDWFSDSVKKGLVKLDVLKMFRNPVREFEYKEREFLAALATNKAFDKDARNSGLINTSTNTFIDPTTASNINVNTNRMYGSPLTLLTDRNSILGQTISNQTDIRTLSSVREGGFEVSRGIADVSTSRPRVEESFAHLAQIPMWFNRECRHVYKKDKARFSKQAFYVGISHVEFLRKDYTQARDDTLIVENLYDNFQIETNTWNVDKPSRIGQRVGVDSTQASAGLLTKLLITYTVDDVTYTDEEVSFHYLDQVIDLANSGNTQAINVQVYLENADGSRGTFYSSGQDYFLDFATDPNTGLIINTIGIDTNSIRLVVTPVSNTFSSATVIGRAIIGSVEDYHGHGSPQFDAATVVGQSALLENEVSRYLDPPTVTPTTIQNAVSVRLGTANPPGDATDSAGTHTAYPDAKVIGIWVQWATLNPAKNTFVMPSQIDSSIEDAIAKGYQVILRIATGIASPSWIYSDVLNPVTPLNLLTTSGPLVPATIPVPWDANLAFHYQNMLNWLVTQFSLTDPSGLTVASGVSVGGKRRKDAIYFMSVSMATELDTDMTVGYGPRATYAPDAAFLTPSTLSGTALASDTRQPEAGGPTSFTLAGTLSGYPSVPWLYKIGSELILGTRSGTTVTIHQGGRGFSGSTVATHNNLDSVFYITNNFYTDTAGTFGSNIVNAIYDRYVWNQGAWLAQGTITQNRNRFNGVNQSPASAWENSIDMMVNTISIPTGIPSCVSYGSAFNDQYSNAALLASKVGRKYPLYLLGMTTNYQPGFTRASSGLQNTFEGGINGANISTADTSGGDPLSVVFAGSGGTGLLTYDTTTAAHGATSAKVTNQINAGLGWNFVGNNSPYFRTYVKFNVLPGSNIQMIKGISGTIKWNIILTTTGALQITNGSGVVKGTSATTLSPNTWYRLEISADITNQTILRIYTSMDSTTIAETVTATDGTNSVITEVLFGNPDSGQILWFDDIAANGTTWFGPASTPAGIPTNVFNGITEPSYYEGWSPLPASVLRAHANAGGAVGVQSADISKFTGFGNPWNRSLGQCAFGLLTEEVFTKFPNFQFLEYTGAFLDQGRGGGDPNQDNYYYLVNPLNTSNVQKRLVNNGVVQVPTGSRTYGSSVISAADAFTPANGTEITFETGDLSQFSSTLDPNSILSVETGNAAFGNYAMHVNRKSVGGVGNGVITIPATNKRVAGRVYLDLERLPDSLQFLFQNVSSVSSNIRVSPTGAISGVVGSVGTSQDIYLVTSNQIGIGNYYRIEWIYDTSTATGKLWVQIYNSSGVSVLSNTNSLWDNTVGAYLITGPGSVADITSIRVGAINTTPTIFEAWMDRVGVRWGATVGFLGA